jgi:hypothetical protein
MRRQLGVAALAGLVLAVSPVSSEERPAEPRIRVLIVDGQNNHDWKATTPVLVKILDSCGRFTVTVATSPPKPKAPVKPKDEKDPEAQAKYKEALEKFQKDDAAYKTAMAAFHPDLGQFDVLLSNYNGDPWSPEFQKDLEDRLRAGKINLVIVHAANNAFGGWAEYNQMIGMGWRGNNFGERLTLDEKGAEVRVPKGQGPGAGHGSRHPFQVVIRDGEHPITRGMPHEWMHNIDELYHGMRGPIKDVHLLATAFSDKARGGSGEHEPMMWTVSYGKGRVFHTPMGHDVEAMRCVGFAVTVQRGAEWAATGKVTIPIPANFPKADMVSVLPK